MPDVHSDSGRLNDAHTTSLTSGGARLRFQLTKDQGFG